MEKSVYTEAVCDPKEVALKSFFLGPKAENADWLLSLLNDVGARWIDWRRSVFANDSRAISPTDQQLPEFVERQTKIKNLALDLVKRFESEVPKFSPRYVGHMFSEVSLPALIGHIVTLLHNPNNISGESSRVGIKIEEEAISGLLAMVGFKNAGATGHFTSGGTVANFEALLRARARYALWLSSALSLFEHSTSAINKINLSSASHIGWEQFAENLTRLQRLGLETRAIEKWNYTLCDVLELAPRFQNLLQKPLKAPVVLVPANAHYSWKKACQILGLGRESLWSVPLDRHGHVSLEGLKTALDKAIQDERSVMAVVSIAGSTELGGIDPIHGVQDLLDAYQRNHGLYFWHHVDAAFGGFFRTLDLEQTKLISNTAREALKAIPRVQSITLDPHKLGYVPYASGAFLCQDKRDYYFSTFDQAPYIDFDAASDRGPYTLEGSRSATGAVATWMTANTMGLHAEGYGLLLERTIRSRQQLEDQLLTSSLPIRIAPGGDTNILCFTCAREDEAVHISNERTLAVFQKFSHKTNGAFIVSKTALSRKTYGSYCADWVASWGGQYDVDEIVLIRMCLMNPFFYSKESTTNYAELFLSGLREAIVDG